MSTQDVQTLVLLIAPIFLVQLGLIIYSLLDLNKRTIVRGPRWAWVLILVLTALAVPGGMIAAAVYLVWGRHPDESIAN